MSEPIRVLQIVTTMNRGGLETMLMNYYRNIDRSRVQFDFIEHRPEKSDYDEDIERLGGHIYRMPRLVPWSRSYRAALKRFFGEHPEYRIVHVHQDCLSSAALCAAKECGVPIRIAHSHAAGQDKNWKYLIKLWYKRRIPGYATDLFACGRDAGDWMFGGAEYRILNNAISAGQNRYNKEVRDKVRAELGLEGAFLLGLTARFSAAKNHLFLLDIFHAVADREPSARLLLVGDGELRESIKRKAGELGLADKVIMTGLRTDVPDLLQAMDVFVMPSNYEGVSLAIVEAQAAGLPCFISDKVPIDCKKTDLVQQLSLNDSPEVWAEAILGCKGVERRDTFQEIVHAGFDIESNAEELQEWYLKK
ncbi:MAG: glycosyltransferase family 1 protein [Eubacteriales bacterium]|nr:glycosyltransferase family 1 protein [Eubacteriales bacterium]